MWSISILDHAKNNALFEICKQNVLFFWFWKYLLSLVIQFLWLTLYVLLVTLLHKYSTNQTTSFGNTFEKCILIYLTQRELNSERNLDNPKPFCWWLITLTCRYAHDWLNIMYFKMTTTTLKGIWEIFDQNGIQNNHLYLMDNTARIHVI